MCNVRYYLEFIFDKYEKYIKMINLKIYSIVLNAKYEEYLIKKPIFIEIDENVDILKVKLNINEYKILCKIIALFDCNHANFQYK